MARMLDALRRLERANRLVAVAPAPPRPSPMDLDDPPFEPTFGPLAAWGLRDAGFAYASHALDDALDLFDELTEDALELRPPESTPAEAANVAGTLDEFDPVATIAQHQSENAAIQIEVAAAEMADAPPATDAGMSIQFAEHWATIALEEFGAAAAPAPQAAAASESSEPPPRAVGSRLGRADRVVERDETARPQPSPAELAALLDFNDPVLHKQYAQLGERLVAELATTTKTCAALVSIEHQPHVSDVTLRTALALAQRGQQVLVIDASLGDKHLTNGLALPVEFGLSEVLKGRVPWQQAVRATATPGLCVLPAGRLTPPRLADDHRLKDVLKELTSQWDLVLLDGGSLAEAPARYVAAAARNVYLVVRLGETVADAAARAAASLGSKEIVLRGCIVTNVK